MDKSDAVKKAASMTGESLGAASAAARQAAHAGCEAAGVGYENAREYLSSGLNYAGEMSDSVADLVQRQPWVALAGAFVLGYIAAKALRLLSQ
jgi:hypothetical protein